MGRWDMGMVIITAPGFWSLRDSSVHYQAKSLESVNVRRTGQWGKHGTKYDVLSTVSSGRSEVTRSHPSVLGIIRDIHHQAESHRELQQQGIDIIHVASRFDARPSTFDVRCSMFDFLVFGPI